MRDVARMRPQDFDGRSRLHLTCKHHFTGLISILLNAVNAKKKWLSFPNNYQTKLKMLSVVVNDFLPDFLRFVCANFSIRSFKAGHKFFGSFPKNLSLLLGKLHRTLSAAHSY